MKIFFQNFTLLTFLEFRFFSKVYVTIDVVKIEMQFNLEFVSYFCTFSLMR